MKRKPGRPKGSKNKATAEVREKFRELVECNLSKFQDDLDSLEPLERLKIIIQLAKFVLPTLKSAEITGEPQPMQPIRTLIFKKIED
ncbi:MAG TPA: hypothetical protein VKX34_06840 [Aequorivita sp.]|nr:hypothetical protein [Aequorivita sp.]